MYYLIDPRSTLSYVTLFMAMHCNFNLECVSHLFTISTLLGDSMVVRRVYRGCVVSVGSRETLVDLIELDMVDFDAIVGID